MPSYNYRCGGCGYLQVVSHPATEKPMIVCNTCGYFAEKTMSTGITMIQQVSKKSTVAESSQLPESQTDHQCGSGCALHQSKWQP